MATLKSVIDLQLASREWDAGTLSRLRYWVDILGQHELQDITSDHIDEALAALALRGRLRPVRNGESVPTGKPLAPATVNRYLSQLDGVYAFARKHRIIPRNFVNPSRGIPREPEKPDPHRYLRPEQVERIVAAARVFDTRWRKLEALIWTAYHTGVRVGDLMALRWADVDLQARTLTVARTKNGDPHTAALSDQVVANLSKLPRPSPDALVFEGRSGQPFHFRRLWAKCVKQVGLAGRNFHQLRHGCGHYLAVNGVNQAAIMAHLGHKTFTASARYMHASTADKARVVARVFGSES